MEDRSIKRSVGRAWRGFSRAMAVCLVLPIALLSPAPSPAQTSPDAPQNSLDAPLCMIRIGTGPRATQLVGVLLGPEPAVGSYRLIVLRQGPSGRSRTVQDGSFTARGDGEETLLGAVAIRLGSGDALDAELTIRAGDRVVCTATL